MDFNSVFKEENTTLLFEAKAHDGEYIGMVNNMCSSFSGSDKYNPKWAWQFPSGRYVIVIYQRHSVYKEGIQIYMNTAFECKVSDYCRHENPRYVLVSDKVREYYISSWGSNLLSYSIKNEQNPLQEKYYDIDDAKRAAIDYSQAGETIVILEWFADYDMY